MGSGVGLRGEEAVSTPENAHAQVWAGFETLHEGNLAIQWA